MKLNGLVNGITKALSKAGRTIVKHAPTIAFVGGAAAVGYGVYRVAKASRTIDQKLEEPVARLDAITERKKNDEANEYSDKDFKRDVKEAYFDVGKIVIKEYGVGGVCLVGGMLLMGGSHIALTRSNAKLAGALTTMTAAYTGVKKKLDSLGPAVKEELLYDLQNKEVDVVTGEDSDGNVTTEKKTVPTVSSSAVRQYSPYAIYFDASCDEWDKNPEYNKTFLHQVEEWANRELRRRGHLFLNEVYKKLGAKETALGQYVGWIYDEVNPVGDNYVDLGYHDVYDDAARRFVNGYEPVVLLDPNVDGEIIHMCLA